MSLHALPSSARPREKILTRGAAALADVELLALLMRTGVSGQGVLPWSQGLLERFGGLAGLLQASASELSGVKGLGPAKRAQMLALLEVARRAVGQSLCDAPSFAGPSQVKAYAALHLANLPHEEFGVLFLNAQHRLITWRSMFRGTLTQTSVYPREVVKECLALNAAAVVLAHNHPSGVAEPSRADETLTQTLKSALQLIDVRVLDHLVVGQGQVVSMAERGLM
jgi:DNA repair protein RadC